MGTLKVNTLTGRTGTVNGAPITFSGDTVTSFPISVNKNVNATSIIGNAHNTTSVKITADALTLFDTNYIGIVVTSVDVTPNLNFSGVNGLDTGTVAATNWYYYWVISNGTTTAGLWSLSNSAPTMPSGYTYKKFMGAVTYGWKSSGIAELYQRGNTIYSAPFASSPAGTDIRMWNDAADGSGNVPENVNTTVNSPNYIPPNADFYTFRFQGDDDSDYVNIHFHSGTWKIGPSSGHYTGIGDSQTYVYGASQAGGQHTLPMITPQTFYIMPVYTVNTVSLYHVGYIFNGIE